MADIFDGIGSVVVGKILGERPIFCPFETILEWSYDPIRSAKGKFIFPTVHPTSIAICDRAQKCLHAVEEGLIARNVTTFSLAAGVPVAIKRICRDTQPSILEAIRSA